MEKDQKMRLLKLEKDDPQKELEFDIQCALEISPSERLEHWLEWNLSLLQFMSEVKERHGHEKTSSLTKRPG